VLRNMKQAVTSTMSYNMYIGLVNSMLILRGTNVYCFLPSHMGVLLMDIFHSSFPHLVTATTLRTAAAKGVRVIRPAIRPKETAQNSPEREKRGGK
jgi:hypothetical protein